MVKLAKWGAVAGLGEGIVKNAETAIKREDDVLEEQRTQRLENIRNSNAIKRDKVRASEDRKRTEMEITGRSDLQDVQIEATATEGVKNRTGEMAVQEERSAGALAVAKVNQANKDKKKWTSNRIKGGKEMNAEGSIVEYPDSIAVTDPYSSLTFVQRGNKLLLQGVKYAKIPDEQDPRGFIVRLINADTGMPYAYLPNPKAENAAEKQALKSEEDGMAFQKAFGYLPISYRKKFE